MSDARHPTDICANDGGSLPGGVVTACPHAAGAAVCPTDFVLSAPCRIVMVGGGSVELSVAELPGFPAGTYAWTTPSTKVRLGSASGSAVTVSGLAAPSSGRDAEVITVTRSAPGCAAVSKTVALTVAKLTFSASASQRYGHDDFDTPRDPLDDHVCIKRSDHSFVHVQIDGGAVGTDFNFVCDPVAPCAPVAPGGTAAFELRLNAGAQIKDSTVLHARCKCPSAHSFSHLAVHVYKENFVEVVVAKIHDSTVAATALHRPAMNAAAHTAAVNAAVKEAVVRYDISNFAAANAVTDVHFDLDGNGALSYDINAGGGAEVNAIAAAFTGTGSKTRIAVVKKLKSYYYLSAAVAVGDRALTLRGGTAFSYASFPNVPLGLGADREMVTVSSVAGGTLNLAAGVTKAHPAGTPIEYIAAGWASDPIILTEENSADGSLLTEDAVLWSIAHEAGHRVLGLADVDDVTNIMNHQQSWTNHRLRYCLRTKYHPPGGTENQWELIPRPPDAP